MKRTLTPRQREILTFMQKHFQKESFWPSIRDIQLHFNFASTNAVAGHLKALTRKGYLVKVEGCSRAYRLQSRDKKTPRAAEPAGEVPAASSSGVAQSDVISFSEIAPDMMEIPIYGSIAAGFPDLVETDAAIGRLQIGVRTVGKRLKNPFALKVRGDSMIDAGIYDGDLVVVEPGIPKNGDIVAALIDGESTLKRFICPPRGAPYLKAENPLYPSFHPATELVVQGIARTVVRNLQ